MTIPKPVLVAFALLLVAAGCGAGGYFVGRETKDESRAFEAGHNEGEREAEADYKPDRAGYVRIWTEGYDEGEADGKRRGIRIGQRRGTEEGFTAGAVAGEEGVFEGYPGGWEIGSLYIVQVGAGSEAGSEATYSIPSRWGPLEGDQAYYLCTDDPREVCEEPY